MSYAGASPRDLRDIVSDVQLATGWLPSQAQDARALLFRAYRVGAKPVMICGHSLGGALAQIIGYEDVPFVTFNAPPIARNLAASCASTGARAAVTAAAWAAGGALFGALAYLRATKRRQAAIGNVKPKAGLNLRLPYDPVSSSSWGGGHVGTVIEIAAEAWTVNRHSMNDVIASLRNSAKNVGSLKVI